MADDAEPDIIFKWTSSCRLCLTPDIALDIFNSDKSPALVFQLQLLLNMLIYRGDPMPRKICSSCLDKLTAFGQFRENCLKTERELKKRLAPYCKIDHVQEYFDRYARHFGNGTVSSTSKTNAEECASLQVATVAPEATSNHETVVPNNKNTQIYPEKIIANPRSEAGSSLSSGLLQNTASSMPADATSSTAVAVEQEENGCTSVFPNLIFSDSSNSSCVEKFMKVIPESSNSPLESPNLTTSEPFHFSKTSIPKDGDASGSENLDALLNIETNTDPVPQDSVGTIISVTGSASDLWPSADYDMFEESDIKENNACTSDETNIAKTNTSLVESQSNAMVVSPPVADSSVDPENSEELVNKEGSELRMGTVPIVAIKQENGLVMCSNCSIQLSNLFAFEHHECMRNESKKCTQCDASFVSVDELKQHKCERDGTEKAAESKAKDDPKIGEDSQSSDVSEKRQLRTRVPKNLNLSLLSHATFMGAPVTKRSTPNHNSPHAVIKMTPWKCVPCEKYFSNKSNLKEHYNSKSCLRKSVVTYKCDNCCKYFMAYQELLQHQIIHLRVVIELTDDDLLQCETCGNQFADETRLRQHSMIHYMKHMSTVSVRYPCLECGEVYFRRDMFELHQRSHNLNFSTTPKSPSRPQKRRNIAIKSTTPHMKAETSPVKVPAIKLTSFKSDANDSEFIKKTQCDYCDAIFENSSLLLKHLSFVHRLKNLKCDHCNKAFFDRNALEDHKKIHSSNLRCRMCGVLFSKTEELKMHEFLKHKNPTPFVCRKCPQRFSTRSHLLIHHRVHLSKSENDDVSTIKEESKQMPDIEMSNPEVNAANNSLQPITDVSTLNDSDSESKPQGMQYKCPLCTKVSHSIYHMTAHITFKHPGKTAFPLPLNPGNKKTIRVKKEPPLPGVLKCSRCSKTFSSRKYLRCHLKSVHKVILPSLRYNPLIKQKPANVLSSNSSSQMSEVYSESKSDIKTCPFCLKQVRYLTTHIKKFHRGERADPNILCKLGANVTADRNLVCRYCFKVCSSPHNRRFHESIHSNSQTQWEQCEICKKKFFSKSLYAHHKKTAHVAESFHCQKCNRIFFKEASLYQHNCPKDEDVVSTARKTFKCLQCPKSYDFLKSLKLHITAAHKTPKSSPNLTNQPPPSVVSRNAVRELWKEESNKIISKVDDKYYCTMCDIELNTTEEVKRHQVSHPRGNLYVVQLTDSCFQCTVCDRMFDSRRGGLVHINYHKTTFSEDMPLSPTGGAPPVTSVKRTFQCPFCNITYSTESNLQNHLHCVHPEARNIKSPSNIF